VTTIVTLWRTNSNIGKILVCAPSNYAADLLAEKFSRIPSIKENVLRVKSQKKNDIFNMKLDDMKPTDLLYKMFLMEAEEKSYLLSDVHTDPKVQKMQKKVDEYF